MKGLVTGFLLWSACLAGTAAAQEVQWRAAAPEPSPPLASCVAIGQPQPAASLPSPPLRGRGEEESGRLPRIVRASAETLKPPPRPEQLPAPDCCGVLAGATGAAAPPSPDGAVDLSGVFGPEPPRYWARAEYLMWWFRNQQAPPLLTTGPAMANGQSGFLGQPGTVVLVGGELRGDVRSGGRFTFGAWCDDDDEVGVEASGFFVGQRSFRFSANSSQFPVLARPFFNLNAMTEFAQEATTPGRSSGSVGVEAPSRLWGAELDLRCNLCCGCDSRLDFLVGPRYLQLDEGLNITESLLGLAGAGSLAGSHILVSDRFNTKNRFYGGQVGLDYELTRGRWSLDLTGKVALGVTHQDVNIDGSQVIVSPAGAVSVFSGGLLALATNSGSFSRDRFAVLPEATATLGFRVTDWCRLSVGYNFLYCSSVFRPGDQIDRVIDVTRIPNFGISAVPTGQARPMPLLRGSDFWAQGINFGVEFRF